MKKIINLEDHARIIHNFISLLFLHGFKYLLPLLLIPYLLRTIHVEKFGLLAFATATIVFFRGVVSYGFDLTGTQQIALERENIKKVSELYSSILYAKAILLLLCFSILIFLLFFVEKFSLNWEVFILSFSIIVGDMLFPVWLFQGMEEMKFITFLNMFSKTVFVVFVFLMVQNENDFLLVPMLEGLISIIIGIISIFLVSRKFGIKLGLPRLTDILYQLKDGWHIFASNMAVHFYTSLNTVVLGFFVSPLVVGYYAITEKIYLAIRSLFQPFNRALFPYLSKKYIESKKEYYILIRKIVYIYIVVLILFSVFSFLCSSVIVKFVLGQEILKVIEIMKVFSVTLVFAIGGLFTMLLVIKFKKQNLMKITIQTMILNIVFIYPIIYIFDVIGLAYLFLFVQFIQFVLQVYYNIEIWSKN